MQTTTKTLSLLALSLAAGCAAELDPGDDPVDVQAEEVAPCSGVSVAASENLQAKIDARPAGTVFCLGAGTFRVTSQIRPKANQVFAGKGPTTILDGGKSTPTSFGYSADGVTVRSLVIQNFDAKGLQLETDWVADDLEVRWNPVGIAMHGLRPVVKSSRIHHNGGPYTTSATRSFGLTSNDAADGKVLGNDIYANNPNCNRTGQNGGGAGANKFWASRRFLLEGNHWHDNFGNGIWLDGSNSDFTIRDELVEGNTNLCGGTRSKVGAAQGIRLEVSCRTTIEDSIVRDNDQGAIWINGSYGNVIRNNQLAAPAIENGVIRTVDVHRDSPNNGFYLSNCGGGAYKSSDNRYTGNTVDFVSDRQYVGMVADSGENISNNLFTANTYRTTSCGQTHWMAQSRRTWSQWRALGHDTTGRCIAP